MKKLRSKFLGYGRRTGVDIIEGKKIRKGEDGLDIFEDYWTETEESVASEKHNRIVSKQKKDAVLASNSKTDLKILRRKRKHLNDKINDTGKESEDNLTSDQSCSERIQKHKNVAVIQACEHQDGANIIEGKNLQDEAEKSDYWTDREENLSSDELQNIKESKSKRRALVRAYGRRTGKIITKGKNIRKDEDGIDVFDDYWTKSRISLEQSRKSFGKQKQSIKKLRKSAEGRNSRHHSIVDDIVPENNTIDNRSIPKTSRPRKSVNSSKDITESSLPTNIRFLNKELYEELERAAQNSSNFTRNSSQKHIKTSPIDHPKLTENSVSRNTRSKRINESAEMTNNEISQSRKNSSLAKNLEAEMHDIRSSSQESEFYLENRSSVHTLSSSQSAEGTPKKRSKTNNKMLSFSSGTEYSKSPSDKETPEKRSKISKKRVSSSNAMNRTASEETLSLSQIAEETPKKRPKTNNKMSFSSDTEYSKSPSDKETPEKQSKVSKKRASSSNAMIRTASEETLCLTQSPEVTPKKQSKTNNKIVSYSSDTEYSKSPNDKETPEKRSKISKKRVSSSNAMNRTANKKALSSLQSAEGTPKKRSKTSLSLSGDKEYSKSRSAKEQSKTGKKRLSSSSALKSPKSKKKASHLISDVIGNNSVVSVAKSSESLKMAKSASASKMESENVLQNVPLTNSSDLEMASVSHPESESRVTKKGSLISPEKEMPKKQNKRKKKLICDGPSSVGVRRSVRKRMAPLPHWLNVYPRFRRTPSGNISLDITKGMIEDDRNVKAILRRYAARKERQEGKKKQKKVGTAQPVIFPELLEENNSDVPKTYSKLAWIRYASPSDDSDEYYIAKAYDSDGSCVGLMRIDRFKKKGLQYVPKDNLYFCIKKGKIKAQVNREVYKLEEGDFFKVSHGKAYSVSNTGLETAFLMFSVHES